MDKIKYAEITGSYSLFIGRFQPPHEGHITLMRKVLEEGGKVCIGLRDTKIDEKNPYNVEERTELFRKFFKEEMENKSVIIVGLPDIKEVVFGRTPGWKIRQIRLDKKLENISATKIRNEQKNV